MTNMHCLQTAVVHTVPKQNVTAVLMTNAHRLTDLQGFGRSALGISSGTLQTLPASCCKHADLFHSLCVR